MGDAFFHVGVAMKIVLQTASDILSLRYHRYTGRNVTVDLVQQYGIVSTTQDDGVYQRIGIKHLFYLTADEVVRTRTIRFIIFNQWDPHGTGDTCDMNIRIQLGYFHIISTGTNRAGSCEYPHVPSTSYVTDTFSRRTNDAKDTIIPSQHRQIPLLDGAQSLG